MYFSIKLKHSWSSCCKPLNFKLSMSQPQSAEIFKVFFPTQELDFLTPNELYYFSAKKTLKFGVDSDDDDDCLKLNPLH